MRRTALIFVGLLLLVGIAAADTLTIPDAAPYQNQQVTVPVALTAANGLSGYNITFSVDNSSVARIDSVTFPAWVTLHSASSTPGTTVTTVGADLGNAVTAPASTTIVSLVVQGLALGSANLTATVNQIDDDAGGSVTPTISSGTITVSSSIRPRASATIPTLSTDLKDDLIDSLGGETVPEPGEDTINWTGLISTIGGAYTSILGPLAYTLIFSIPFLMMWITQRDMTLPGLVGALFGLFIIVRLPAEFHLVAVTFIAISIVAVVYSLVKERV